MAVTADVPAPALPFPIFRVSTSVERYMLYDINIITWLRKTHRILGVLIGTLPQIPQQNVFLGLPLQLMAEEARLLAERGLAYIVLDNEQHRRCLMTASIRDFETYSQSLEREGREAAVATEKKRMASKQKALTKFKPTTSPKESTQNYVLDEEMDAQAEETALFPDSPSNCRASANSSPNEACDSAPLPWSITPTTTRDLLVASSEDRHVSPPTVKQSSFSLFKMLHAKGYFVSPGLRFGCQYMVYPGDPLRFHSHFLAVGAGWDEELDLLDLVGGGRLGTAVKKGFLLGGPSPAPPDSSDDKTQDPARVFCIEWGGM